MGGGGKVPAVEKQLWQPVVTFEHSVYIEYSLNSDNI